MILTSHIIVGGLVAGKTSNYFLAAIIGLASHYILDTLPHWEYSIQEYKNLAQTHDFRPLRKRFLIDSLKIGLDAFIGFSSLILMIFYLDPGHPWFYIIGGFFGIIPDILQFLYWVMPYKPLKAHYDFQFWIHDRIRPRPIIGALMQAVIIAIVIGVYLLLR